MTTQPTKRLDFSEEVVSIILKSGFMPIYSGGKLVGVIFIPANSPEACPK